MNIALQLARATIVAALLSVPVLTSGAQNVRVIQRDVSRSDSIVERIFISSASDVKRIVAAWREREMQLVREMRALPASDAAGRRRIDDELAKHAREGFAIMSALESRCMNESGRRPAGYLGVNIDIGVLLHVESNQTRVHGNVVTSVEPGSPAQRGGIQAGDRLIRIAELDAREEIPDLTELLVPGRRLVVRVERAGAPVDVPVTIARRPEGFGDACSEFDREVSPIRMTAPGQMFIEETVIGGSRRIIVRAAPPERVQGTGEEIRFRIFDLAPETRTEMFVAGAQIRSLDADWREVLGVQSGVIVNEVANGSAAAAAGLRGGDVIIAVGKSSVASPVMFLQLLGITERQEATLSVMRGKERKTLVLRWGTPRAP